MKELIEKYKEKILTNKRSLIKAERGVSVQILTGEISAYQDIVKDLESLQSKGKTKSFREVFASVLSSDDAIQVLEAVEIWLLKQESHANKDGVVLQHLKCATLCAGCDENCPGREYYFTTQPTNQQPEAMKDGWVSCAERLPKQYQEVLFFLKKTEENGLQHDAIVKTHVLDSRATHWMPLPTPPQK